MKNLHYPLIFFEILSATQTILHPQSIVLHLSHSLPPDPMPTKLHRITVNLPPKLSDRITQEAGDAPLATFILKLLIDLYAEKES